MSLRTVARRYAGALFDVARRNGVIDRVEGQLHDFNQLLAAQADLRRVFETAAVAPQKKRAILDAVLEKTGGVDGEVRQMLRMLADRDRLMLLPEVIVAFDERIRQERRLLQAEVVTAVPLPEAQRAALSGALRRAAGSDLTITRKSTPRSSAGSSRAWAAWCSMAASRDNSSA